MVDWYGNWTYEKNTPEEKKCDYDRIADWVVESGYQPKTSIENLVHMIVISFDLSWYGDEFPIENYKQYVEDYGGFKAFDYYA